MGNVKKLTIDDLNNPVLYVEGTPWIVIEYNCIAKEWLSSSQEDVSLKYMDGKKLITFIPDINQSRLERRISKGQSATVEMTIVNDTANRTALFHFRPFKNGVLIEGYDNSSVKETKAMLASYSQILEEKQNEIQQEHARAESLLANILPTNTIRQLKTFGKTIPERYADVSVLFLDFVGFTETSEAMEPEILFGELNEIFTAFDVICEKYNCERIKTIGDAYLAVSGMNSSNEEHAFLMTSAALEMRKFLFARNQCSSHQWLCKIGIHSGPLVGGVVGKLKYIYDIFGDGVNTASRMESTSETMKINISQSTHSKIEHLFTMEKRKLLAVKGKGEMQTYFVNDFAN